MAAESLVDQQFTDGFNEANACYKADRLEECESKLRDLLEDSAIPRYFHIQTSHELLADPTLLRYHRMKSLILLGLILGDWHGASECYVQADALWRVVRRWHPEGDDKTVDDAMKEIRESLEDLDAALREEDAFEYDRHKAVTEAVAKHDAGVDEARATMQAMGIHD
jgi:hypothetical protein